MKLRLAAAGLIALSVTTSAWADSKSWSAARATLPDNVNVVVGANVSALRATSLYQSFVPLLVAKEPKVQEGIDRAKSVCGIDLHSAVVDATFAMGEDERGVLVLALDKTLDQKRLVDCVNKLLATRIAPSNPVDLKPTTGGSGTSAGGLKGGSKKSPATTANAKSPPAPATPKVVVKTIGKITEYSVDADPQRFYVAWLAADVAAIATDPDDRVLLEKMTAGKGPKAALNAFLGKANPNAAVWLATTKPQPIPTGGTMKGGFGTIETAKGNVSVDLSIVMTSAKEAKNFVDQATQLIASAKNAIPPQFQKLVDALKLTASADAANVKVVATEKDVLGLLALAMSNL